MSDDRQSMDQLLDFPARFTFRVVAEDQAELCAACQRLVEAALGRPVERVAERPSKSGRYRTVRLTATVHEGAEVERAYQALNGLAGVKMLL